MAWWSAEEWRRMKAGDGCPMCADAALPSNHHSDLVVVRPFSFVRLHHNQTQAGYCVVILNEHVSELHEMTPSALAGFWSDVAAVGQAVAQLFQPIKIDNLVMGHRCPHLHCHVYPQYASDDPCKVVDISAGTIRLTPDEQQHRIAQLRLRLAPRDYASTGSPTYH